MTHSPSDNIVNHKELTKLTGWYNSTRCTKTLISWKHRTHNASSETVWLSQIMGVLWVCAIHLKHRSFTFHCKLSIWVVVAAVSRWTLYVPCRYPFIQCLQNEPCAPAWHVHDCGCLISRSGLSICRVTTILTILSRSMNNATRESRGELCKKTWQPFVITMI